MDIVLADAVAWIAQGGVLAYPPRPSGARRDAKSDAAIGRLRAFKGRGGDARSRSS